MTTRLQETDNKHRCRDNGRSRPCPRASRRSPRYVNRWDGSSPTWRRAWQTHWLEYESQKQARTALVPSYSKARTLSSPCCEQKEYCAPRVYREFHAILLRK